MPPSHPAGSQRLLSRINSRALLEVLDTHGELARPEIVSTLGLSKTAVGNILNDLLARNIVHQTGTDPNRRGPVASVFGLNPSYRFGGAIDVGHRTVSAAVVNLTGDLIARQEAEPHHTKSSKVDLAQTLLAKAAQSAGTSVGSLDRVVVGYTESSPNTPTTGSQLRAGLNHLPSVTIYPATHLATEAELNALTPKDIRNFVLIRLGGRLEVGVVVNGKVLHGANHQAGLGVPYAGLTASSITDAATTAGLGALSAREVFARAKDQRAPCDQAHALSIVHAVAAGLAPVVRWVSQLLDPQLIVFGGGIGANTDLLVPAITQSLAPSDSSSFPPFARTYAGTDPVLTGAALLTSHHMRQAAFDDVASKPRVT